MKRYIYGFVLGIALSVIITFTNVVFPNNGPDSAPGMLLVASLIGCFIIWSSHLESKNSKDKNRALKVGVFTSFIGFILPMITFVVIDNYFLSIVSQQSDKIATFREGGFSSMKEMINLGLLRGFIYGIPGSLFFGLICGFLGSRLSKTIILLITALTIGLLILLSGISQIKYLEKAHSTFENYSSFRGCMQLVKKTTEYGICKISSGQEIKIVRFQGKWYLDGDLPCGFFCF